MIAQEVLETLTPDFYGNNLVQWAIASGILIFGTAILGGLKIWFTKKLGDKAKQTVNTIDDVAVELIKKTRVYFYGAIALKIAIAFLELSARDTNILHTLILLAILLQVAIWINTLIDQVVQGYAKRHTGADAQGTSAIKTMSLVVKSFVLLILILIALQHSGFEVKTLLAGLGIGGIAVALAIQNILGDLFAAFSIIIDKPFVVGDSIQVDSLQGTVERVGLKTTRVRSTSGEQIIFANGDLLKSRIRNYRRMYQRRIAFTLKLSSNTTAEKIEIIPTLVRDIIERQTQVRFDKCHFLAITDSGYMIDTVYFVTTPSYDRYLDVQQTINLEILKGFRAAEIELAAPSPPVVLKSGDIGDSTQD